MRESANLRSEIEEVKTGVNESSIKFKNGSVIFTAPYSENALGKQNEILITFIIRLNPYRRKM